MPVPLLGIQTRTDFIVMHQEGNNSVVCCPCGSITLAPPEHIYKNGARCARGCCPRSYCTRKDGQVVMLVEQAAQVRAE